MLEKIPAPTPREELHVLVIDNQGLVHDVVASALHEIGIKNVSSAFNAFHAKRLCEARQFDFVLLSFNVSHDKDGFHLFEELKHLNHINDTTTVVFLSAETSPELVNCIVELQPDDFWVKPLQRNKIESRLDYLIQVRLKLHKMLYCMQIGDYSTAMYYAERQLKDALLSEYHTRIKRLIGDCLLQLRDYETAEDYFRGLLQSMDHAWVHIGLTRSLLRQDELEEAQLLVDDLLQRPDTRFLTYDLLAQYFIEKEQFDIAYEQMKEASRLAPRNIERNKRLWDLARLNHDKKGQLSAVQNMAKFAKNSIHDSPQLTLNVIRSTIDLATSLGNTETERYLQKAESELEELKQQKGMQSQLGEQIDVVKARVLCLRDDKRSAEKLMKDRSASTEGLSMEDSLDKMKAFHELGMREHCVSILDKLRKQIEGDTFTSQVVNEYLNQESIERSEIQFTTKELKQMATVNYKENRLNPAYNNLLQALTLSPKDKQIALSLLKVITQIHLDDNLSDEQMKSAKRAAKVLLSSELSTTQAEKRDQYIKRIGIEVDDTNAADLVGMVVSKA
ncbi:response regulator [Alteromonas mediterranea]|uniref:Response regulator receiver protein n=3 Tax=Alteromonas mediterranea TaxID=314275 RepID=S5ACA6_9ALTE|nr:response regulator [Alteromonas mediterranea]AGP77862.1 response regulator receiver protein [Alteromonas mediterranea 615]AGP93439.1 response regulator receiver protein [Alteromonas mediterranea U8]MBR9784011.1 response regulator [Gammaproteobacteria bacterium]AEA97933.1 chemotaxis protein CheY [Alteromonas mediterranea DE]AFV85375.1 response regulator receiver protein [Alteromonas mediterranea DE1]|tara:strand:- start:4703 stop:6388 length:1686 start_codon:yes stop_codon:yes gene_type:complete